MEEFDKEKKEISLKKSDEGKLIKPDFQRNKLFKKGVHQMADEKLEEAARTFEMILRTDPNDVEALLKLGYSRFHLDDFLVIRWLCENMRLDRAGSIGLHVGPLTLGSTIDE